MKYPDYKIRDEYKFKVYTDYLLPSVRLFLTIHDITKTGLNTLDQTVDQYFKKWCSLPKSATNSILHLQSGLGIKPVTHLDRESHTMAYA